MAPLSLLASNVLDPTKLKVTDAGARSIDAVELTWLVAADMFECAGEKSGSVEPTGDCDPSVIVVELETLAGSVR